MSPPPPPPNSSSLLPPPPPTLLVQSFDPHLQQQLSSSKRSPLIKHKSWSPDICREEVWTRRKGNHHHRQNSVNIQSVTDEDLDELKGCIELGFGFKFESSEIEPRLSDALPALNFYHAVNKRYYDSVFKSSPPSPSSSSSSSLCDSPPSDCGHDNIFGPGDNPQMVKTRLRQWAQVVACSVRQSAC